MIEVLKQALKAFEVATTPFSRDRQEVIQAQIALRQAIAELESQEPDVVRLSNGTFDVIGSRVVPLGALLYLHPPQRTEQNFCSRCGKRTNDIHTCTPPQPAKPIPCANDCEAAAFEIVIKNLQGEIERLKASQRTWVGLTDEEICLFSMWLDSKPDATVFTAIEAKLKEKNT